MINEFQVNQMGKFVEGHKEIRQEGYIRKKEWHLQNLFFFFFLAVLCSMQDFSSLTRDRTHAPCIGNTEY